MLTLGIYIVLGLACAGILFFLSVAVFGGSTTARPPLTPEEAADQAAHPPAPEPDRSDLVVVARDSTPVELPADRAVIGDDLDRLRLPVALRGYRMAETDQALDRLARELRERDALIADLRTRVDASGEDAAPAQADRAPLDPHGPGQAAPGQAAW